MISLIALFTLQQLLWQMKPGSRKNRLIIGLTAILGSQILLFFLSGILSATSSVFTFLPLLDRAFIAILLIWSAWMWIFPQKNKWGDLILIILNLLTLVITGVMVSLNNPNPGFNLSAFDLIWELFFLLIVLSTMGLIIRKRDTNWEFGFSFFLIQLIGIGFHLGFADQEQNLSALIRFSQMIAFPLLPGLIQKPLLDSVPKKTKTSQHNQLAESRSNGERKRFSAELKTFITWLSVVKENNPQEIAVQLTRAIAETMRVDICIFTNAPSEFGDISILCGYDLIRDAAIDGETIPKDKITLLSNAIKKGKPFWFSPQNAPLSSDISTIRETLKLSKLENLLVIPLKEGNEPIGSILLLSPYADREWNDEDFEYISSAVDPISRILINQSERLTVTNKAGDFKQQLERAQQEIQTLSKENTFLEKQIKDINETKDTFSAAYQLEQFTKLQEESTDLIERLQSEIERLENEIIEKASGVSEIDDPAQKQIEEELKLTLEEVARLQNELADAKVMILTYEQLNEDIKGVNEEEREVIQSIVQEIRQPMSSILGYTDLLIGESVGELGGLQKKFLEKIKSSNEKMRSLLDDLIHISTFEANKFEITRETTNLSEIIDIAIKNTSAQMQEKDISLQLDIPDELPQINVDKEAIQKVLTHLLENAGAATPNEGEITLHIKTEENEYDERYLMLMVEDTGGGVPEDLVNIVFSRRYKAENPLIPGLGDTGVSLSIAKTLVEAHNGRIWVETIPDVGTQFTVLIPLESRVD